MKKYLLACLLALPVTAADQRAAFAWMKLNAGIGANVGFATGGNKCLLWGAYQSSDFNSVSPQAMYPPTGHGDGPYGGMSGGPFGGLGAAPFGDPGTGTFSAPPLEPGPMPAPSAQPAPVKPAQYPGTYPQSDALPVGYESPYPINGFYPAWYGN